MTNETIRLTYATAGESAMANRIVDAFLAKGYTISVYDGGETTVKRSKDRTVILLALATTGEDTLTVRQQDGTRVGAVTFIYGNAEDGSELAADWSAVPLIDEVLELLLDA